MSILPIQTALCSFGMSGKVFHAPFVQVNKGYNLYGVWERSKKTATEIYPAIKSFDTLEEMLADDNIELVIVNTPNATHYDYAAKALRAGKHVIVEKPFVLKSAEGEALAALAAECNKKISVYHNRRYDSDTAAIKKVLDEQLLGEIAEAEFRYDRYRPQLSAKVHKETPGPGTGLLYDLGSHLIDQALQLFGKPQYVFGDVTTLRPVSKVSDYFEVLLYYPGKRIRLVANNLVREPVPAYVLHGHKGSFIKPRGDVQENDLIAGEMPGTASWGTENENDRGLLHTEKNGGEVKEYLTSPRGDYMQYFDQMYNAIRMNGPVPVTAAEGTEVIRIIENIYKELHGSKPEISGS